MFVPLHLLLTLVLFRAFESTLADKNITIDDADGAIQYSAGWSVSSGANSLDFGGFHHLSDATNATANFTFTGVAVYIMAPLWPYGVGAQAGVDGSSPVAIDMQDHTHTDPNEGPEDVNTTVLWGMEGLTNSSHTLQISFLPGEQFVALDAIIYTVKNSSSPTASSTPSAASTPKKSKSKTGIIAGVVAGAVVLGLIAMGLAMCLARRRKNPVSGVTGTAGAAAFVGGTTGSSRTYEGKSYGTAAHDSPSMVPVPLGSADSFGNRASQYPASFVTATDPYRDSMNMPPLPNTMPTKPGYGQPVSQYGGGSQYYGTHDANSQYGHPSDQTSYSPYDAQHASTASALAAATAAAAAGGAHLPYPGDTVAQQGNYNAAGPTVPPQAPQSFLAAPGQVTLSYAGAAAPVPSPGSSSSRSDVYTTKPVGASEEKQRLALAYRSEEEVEEPPPEYS